MPQWLRLSDSIWLGANGSVDSSLWREGKGISTFSHNDAAIQAPHFIPTSSWNRSSLYQYSLSGISFVGHLSMVDLIVTDHPPSISKWLVYRDHRSRQLRWQCAWKWNGDRSQDSLFSLSTGFVELKGYVTNTLMLGPSHSPVLLDYSLSLSSQFTLDSFYITSPSSNCCWTAYLIFLLLFETAHIEFNTTLKVIVSYEYDDDQSNGVTFSVVKLELVD
jgi:hypothetical protein